MRKMVKWGSAVLVVVIAYLLLWPVPIDPVAWDAPKNRGYAGAFAANDKLESLNRISMNGLSGPEDGAVAPDGLLYMASHEGAIVQYDPAGQTVSQFAHTNGRPLGLEFGPDGVLYVADAYRGLLAISPNGDVTLMEHRYSDFAKLNEVFKSHRITLDTSFPTKHWAGRMGNWTPSLTWAPEQHTDLVEFRKIQLDVWLVHVVEKYNIGDLPYSAAHAVYDFLTVHDRPPCEEENQSDQDWI